MLNEEEKRRLRDRANAATNPTQRVEACLHNAEVAANPKNDDLSQAVWWLIPAIWEILDGIKRHDASTRMR